MGSSTRRDLWRLTLPFNESYMSVMRSEAPPLLPVFRSRHQAQLLAWLLLHPGGEFSLTDLARTLTVSTSTLHREVERLVTADLIRSRNVGRTRLLRANPAHRATAPLTQLLELSFGPQPVLAEEFALADVEEVLIYGSWAERYHGVAGPPPHDVDVLVVGSPARIDVYAASDRAQERLGLPVNPVIRSPEQWRDPRDPLSSQIRSAARLTVYPQRRQE